MPEAPDGSRRDGFFEPACLCLCWCDFLGALHLGHGKSANQKRVIGWLKSRFMNEQNEKYRHKAKEVYRSYRNGLVHGYACKEGCFTYDDSGAYQHLDDVELDEKRSVAALHIPTLLDDMVAAVEAYGASLAANEIKSGKGSAEKFWKGLKEMREFVPKKTLCQKVLG